MIGQLKHRHTHPSRRTRRHRSFRRKITLETLEDRRLLSAAAPLTTGGTELTLVEATNSPLLQSPAFVSAPELSDDNFNAPGSLDPRQFVPMPRPDSSPAGSSPGLGQLVTYDVATGTIEFSDNTPGTTAEKDIVSGGDGLRAAGTREPNEGGFPDNFGSLSLISGPDAFPWSVNVKTFQTFPNGASFVCSGTLIDPSHVLTAGHCVYDASRGGFASSMSVVPAYDNGAEPFGRASANQLHTWTGWSQNQNTDHDMGVIDLDRAIGALTGWHGYGFNNSVSFYTESTFHNPGYPAETPYNGQDMYYWFGDFDFTESFNGVWTGNEVGINSYSYGGQSGSGAYHIDNGSRYVHAVLSNGSSTSTYFPRITSGKFQDIRDQVIGSDTPSTFDLMALDVALPVTTVSAGGQLSGWNYLVHNYSTVSWSGTVNVNVYLSNNSTITTTDQLVQSHQFVSTVGPKGSVVVGAPTLTIPSSVTGGSYYIGVILDIADHNVNNNDSSGMDAAALTVVPDDHGNDAANATLIGTDSETAGNLEIASDQDWFRFYADTGSQVTLETTLASLGDSTLRLYDTDGVTLLIYDDDSGLGSASRIDFVLPSRGQYYVSVASFAAGYAGTYHLSLTHFDDHGDDFAGATWIVPGSVQSGTLEVGGDKDWFSFAAAAGTEVTLETSLGTLGDSTLTLYDEDGTSQLAFDDDGGSGLASRLTYTFAFTGDYFVKVTEFGQPDDAGTYDLSLTLDDHADSAQSATLIGAASTTMGNLEVTTDEDWFIFYAESGAQVTLETSLGSLIDSILTLYDSDGTTQLAFNDDGGVGLASRIEHTVGTTGNYYVSVASFGGGYSGSYELSLQHVDDHGDSASLATPIAAGTQNAGRLEVGGDTDWFEFFAPAGGQVTFETILGTLADSTLTLLDTDGLTPLAFDDDGGPGLASRIDHTFSAAGQYFVMVTEYGYPNGPGSYDLAFSVQSSLLGDFDNDGAYTCADVNALVAEIAAGTNNTFFDMNGDLAVNLLDRDLWLSTAGEFDLGPGKSYLLGDANLDGVVDGQDFILWNGNKFTSIAAWCSGDFNADGVVDGLDFIIWNNNKFQASDGLAVPPALQASTNQMRNDHLFHTNLKELPLAPDDGMQRTSATHQNPPAALTIKTIDAAFASLPRTEVSDHAPVVARFGENLWF